nr:ABC transporter ATP-binding protein [Portibacter lacus]
MSNTLNQLQSIISILSLIAGLIYFEPLLIILLVLSIIPSFFNEIKFSNQRYSLARSWTSERRELDYLRYIGANSNTAKEIKLFGLTKFVADRFRNLSDKYYELNKNIVVKRTAYGTLFNILGVLSYYGAYVFIIFRVLSGVLTIGELTFLSGSFNRLRNNLQQFFSLFTRISESALYLKDYFDFIDLKIDKPSKKYADIPADIKEGFVIDNLHFRYPGSEDEVLKGVNFKIKAGEKMAFVGQNGAGKTTLIKLILGFYEPTEGAIYLDGININQFDPIKYQAMFGVIFQDFFRYEFTIKENIAVGNIDELDDQDRIERAAALSLADQVISEMPDGYDQQLGRRFVKGQELSGGQWQKVALARAYMKDANVLILDEPTSALDARAEFDVFERFINLTKGKTSIIISHRFSTVRMADRIIVLEDGKISSMGTHEELMDMDGLYSELFELQAAGYQ